MPLVYAARKLDALALDNSKSAERELVALSKKYGIATRLTSFIVLENEAMFREFDVDRNERLAWSGDGEIDYEAQGEIADEGSVLAASEPAVGGDGTLGGKGALAGVASGRASQPPSAKLAPAEEKAARRRGRASAAPPPSPAMAAAPLRSRGAPFDSAPATSPTKRKAAPAMPPKMDKVLEIARSKVPYNVYWHHQPPQWQVTIRQLAASPSPAAIDRVRSLEAAVRAAPMDRRARKNLVTALIANSLLDEAARALSEWAALDRSNPEVHLLAGDLFKLHIQIAVFIQVAYKLQGDSPIVSLYSA